MLQILLLGSKERGIPNTSRNWLVVERQPSGGNVTYYKGIVITQLLPWVNETRASALAERLIAENVTKGFVRA